MAPLAGRFRGRFGPAVPRDVQAVAAAGVLVAAMLGVLLATNVLFGIALLLALLYAPLVFLNLPAAIAIWVALPFFEGIPGVRLGPEGAGVLITAGWVATLMVDADHAKAVLRRHRVLFTGLAGFLIWISLTLAWADDVGLASSYLWPWFEIALFLLIVATAITSGRHLRWVLTGFVLGAACSVLIGFFGQGLGTAETAEAAAGSRLQGGSGDPNYLAAGLVPALTIGAGLLATTRSIVARWWMAIAITVVLAGLVSSESRGGFIACIVVAVLAVIIAKRRRALALATVLAFVAVGSMWFVTNPAAWQRIAESREDSGSGRVDLWRIGWRMIGDAPVAGVGLRNFGVEAPQYTRQPGALRFVIHVERRQEPHNVYIGLWAETGIVGLILFLIVAGAALRSALVAGSRFDALGDSSLALVSRMVFLGIAGMLTASFFLPNGTDKRLWLLMGIAVALLATAERMRAERRLTSEQAYQAS